jgi:predicted O-linked N-acetylglucosamine transferase (SPINDLY family)
MNSSILLIDNQLLSDNRRLRAKLALRWLNASSSDLPQLYTGDIGSKHRNILTSDCKNFPLLPEERNLIGTQIALRKEDQQTSYFTNQTLAAMLYLGPHQMPVEFDVERLPDWFQLDYWHFLLSPPKLFHELNEVENYYCYFKDLVEFLHQKIRLNPSSKLWQRMAMIFIQKANFIPLYFSKENLADLYRKRAEIAEFALILGGFETDIFIPPHPIGMDKIRLGIYANSISPYTETYATLPFFEHLNHREFQIFLYVRQSDGNPLELYAKNMVDRFMVLPENTKTCSNIIRSDNLDVLFFSNNITAVTNQAFILANHRLARKQIVHFCQPATTGIKHIDHFLIGNMIHENRTAANQYSEKLVKLKGSGLCFDFHTRSSETNAQISLERLGTLNNTTMFISGANFFKITPELRHLWAKIISQAPDSILVLYPFGPAWSNSYPKDAFIKTIEEVFLKYHISKKRLIVLEPLPNRGNIISLLRSADVYLDAVPYSGATSLLDPLEAVVPPVVVQGDKLRFYQGAAILKDLGVPELVVNNETEYMQLALTLAHDSALRDRVKHAISTKMQGRPRFLNPKSYAKEISHALKNIVQSQPEFDATPIESKAHATDRDIMILST